MKLPLIPRTWVILPTFCAAVAAAVFLVSQAPSAPAPALAGNGDEPTPTVPPLEPFEGLYAGVHSGGGNVVVDVFVFSDADSAGGGSNGLPPGEVDFTAENVPLGEPCGGMREVFFGEEPLFLPGTLWRFEVHDPEEGAFGVLNTDHNDGERVVGGGIEVSVMALGEKTCPNTVSYTAEMDAVQQGDVNCSWKDKFPPEGSASSAGEEEPPDTNGVDSIDALVILQLVAQLPTPTPSPDCPAAGTELPNGLIVGNVDCNPETPVDSVDGLRVLISTARLPQPPGIPDSCPRLGIFYSPDP